ncbi:MAG: polysaccharide deacetylase family protein [Gemmatimonadales bacterium]|nr:polysaccharide deacetylase family protein [Gemmatimonadales bacterium]
MRASVSLDLDDLWSYQKTHGNPDWVSRPSYLRLAVPRILDTLDEIGLRITFFIVGFDAAREENGEVLRQITARGHEVANHSFEHDPWLHLHSDAALEDDLARAEAAIRTATGQDPKGFRGPGFSWSPSLLSILERRGYRYDASTLPTFLGPVARWYFLAASPLKGAERAQRAKLFGGFAEGFRPSRAYRWRWSDGRRLLEIPVSTIPGIKAPFHLSYLLYLARFSPALARGYLATAIAACRLAGFGPSFLLHPLDLLDGNEVPSLRFFPGMDVPVARKRAVFVDSLTALARHFELVPMGAHADELAQLSLSHRNPESKGTPAPSTPGGPRPAGTEAF